MATLILQANTASPLTITCQRAGKSAPRLVGSVTPSFNGSNRSSIRGQAKVIPILASFVDTATEATIQAAAYNGAQIPCSGDILQNIQTLCSIDGVVSNMIPGLPGYFEMSFTVNEVYASTVLLKYAAGDTITGETFSRSTTATYHDSAKAVRTAAINVKRDSHYQLIGGTRSLLLEDTRTNLLLRSEEFDNAAWVKSNVTVTANTGATAAPDGSTNSEKVLATATAGTSLTQAAVVAATVATYSIYIKKGSGATDANGFGIFNVTTATNLLFVTINYDTGAITYTTGSSGATLEVMGNGWYRLTMSVTSGITSGNSIQVYACFSSGTYTANTFAYVWGAQLEAAAFASSYIPTTTVAVTRGADSYSLPLTTPPQELTWYMKHVELGTLSTGATSGLFGVGASTNAAFFIYSSGGLYQALHRRTADVSSTLAVAPTLGATNEIRSLLFGDGSVQIGQSVSGAAETTGAQSAVNALGSAWFNTAVTLNERGGGVGFTAIQSFKILAGSRSLAEMRAA